MMLSLFCWYQLFNVNQILFPPDKYPPRFIPAQSNYYFWYWPFKASALCSSSSNSSNSKITTLPSTTSDDDNEDKSIDINDNDDTAVASSWNNFESTTVLAGSVSGRERYAGDAAVLSGDGKILAIPANPGHEKNYYCHGAIYIFELVDDCNTDDSKSKASYAGDSGGNKHSHQRQTKSSKRWIRLGVIQGRSDNPIGTNLDMSQDGTRIIVGKMDSNEFWVLYERHDLPTVSYKSMGQPLMGDQGAVQISGDGATIVAGISIASECQIYRWGVDISKNDGSASVASWVKAGYIESTNTKRWHKLMHRHTAALSHDGSCMVVQGGDSQRDRSLILHLDDNHRKNKSNNTTTLGNSPVVFQLQDVRHTGNQHYGQLQRNTIGTKWLGIPAFVAVGKSSTASCNEIMFVGSTYYNSSKSDSSDMLTLLRFKGGKSRSRNIVDDKAFSGDYQVVVQMKLKEHHRLPGVLDKTFVCTDVSVSSDGTIIAIAKSSFSMDETPRRYRYPASIHIVQRNIRNSMNASNTADSSWTLVQTIDMGSSCGGVNVQLSSDAHMLAVGCRASDPMKSWHDRPLSYVTIYNR